MLSPKTWIVKCLHQHRCLWFIFIFVLEVIIQCAPNIWNADSNVIWKLSEYTGWWFIIVPTINEIIRILFLNFSDVSFASYAIRFIWYTEYFWRFNQLARKLFCISFNIHFYPNNVVSSNPGNWNTFKINHKNCKIFHLFGTRIHFYYGVIIKPETRLKMQFNCSK